MSGGETENGILALNTTPSEFSENTEMMIGGVSLNLENTCSKFDENIRMVETEEEQAIYNVSKEEDEELIPEKMGNLCLLQENDVEPIVAEENDSIADLVGFLFEKDVEGNVNGTNECTIVPKEECQENDIKLTLPEITITRPSESESITEEDTLMQESGSLEEKQNAVVFAGVDNSDDVDKKSGNEKEEDKKTTVFLEDDEKTEEEMGYNLGDDDNDKTMRGKTVMYFPQREVRNGKVIGEGGFGRVLKGNLHGGTPVAIKLFHAPFTRLRDPSELESLLTLKHKNIVTVFGIVEQTVQFDCPQLVLQYVSEGSVLQYLSRHENPEDNSTLGKIALDIVEGCQYLQKCEIVHGNLAARNVMVERVIGRHKTYYNAKICDIGFIKFAEGSGGNYMKLPGGDRIITVRWVPKEIIDVQEDGSIGSDFTYKSDVWSFGVVLWEIWTRGAIPYGASYSNLRVIQFLMDGASPLKIHRPSECPPQVVSLMESIFRVNPAERPSFDQIHDCFKSYKGYGKENKTKSTLKSVPPKSSSKFTAAASGGDDSSDGATASVKVTASDQLNLKLDEKVRNKKVKKNNKKPFPGNKVEDKVTTSQGGAAAVLSEVPHMTPMPTCKKESSPHQHDSSTDSTIAALLKRVNQLEKERRGGGYMTRGGGNGGGPRSPHWPKRMAQGPPRFHRGRSGYQHQEYIEEGRGSPIAVGRGVASSPPPHPPATSQAPPPYTEDPLPHHSTSRFTAPLSEYDYGSPGGRGSRGAAYPGDRTEDMGRPAGPQARVVGGEEEDYIRKVKRLAEEIEVLRAEKMTQELLKKSAELAGVMKIMTTERSKLHMESPSYSSGSTGLSGVVRGGRGNQPPEIPPRLVRRTSYYEDDGYYNNYEYGQHYDGHRQHHRSWNSPSGGAHRHHERNSRGDYQGSHPPTQSNHYGNSQRRPYYMKTRGGGGNGNRGGYTGGGRYHESDDNPYGQQL